jgi:RNA polymerase sigma factor (TIGR02999 family)
MAPSPDITRLLVAWSDGDRAALDALAPLVQDELRRLAARHLAGERPGRALHPTELVNEAYVRLIEWKAVRWQNRAHFFGIAAHIMRHILVDFARRRGRAKRGDGRIQVSLSDVDVPIAKGAELVALDDALEALEELDPRKVRVIEMRFFGGLTLEEIAGVLGMSVGTVRRDWSLARTWLHRELRRAR